MFAPFFVQPQPFACYTHCYSKPNVCREPSACCPFPFLLFLPFLFAFPCFICIATKLFFFLLPVLFFALVCSTAGDVLSAVVPSAPEKPCDKKSCPKPCDKKSCPRTDHSTVSVTSDETTLTIAVSAPGVATKDLDVQLQAGEPPSLTIKGESTIAGTSRGVERTILLPKDVDVDKMSAQHADGLLTVKVPKKLTPAPKPIKIVKAPAPDTDPSAATSTSEPPPTTPTDAAPSSPPTTPAAVADHAGRQSPEWEVVKESAKSVDDAMLADLAFMGFNDRAHNAALLAKHGSLKAVVKELVADRRTSLESKQ